MLSLGQRLRQQREQRKMSLDAIAEQTKISARYLQAIETENFQELPSGLFRRSFVRQYAEALGVEDSALEPEIDQLFGSAETSRNSSAPEQTHHAITVDPLPGPGSGYHRDRRMGWAIGLLIFALAACTGIYALWERTQRVPVIRADRGSEPVPQANAATGQPEPVSATAARQQESAASDASVPSAAPAPPAKPTSSRIRMEVSVTERTWVRLTADGRNVFTGTMQPQETKSFEGVERTEIRVGNAGAVEVRWNGRSIGPIGERGQVRSAEFTQESYLILSPSP